MAYTVFLLLIMGKRTASDLDRDQDPPLARWAVEQAPSKVQVAIFTMYKEISELRILPDPGRRPTLASMLSPGGARGFIAENLANLMLFLRVAAMEAGLSRALR
jgi:hypothetical protein